MTAVHVYMYGAVRKSFRNNSRKQRKFQQRNITNATVCARESQTYIRRDAPVKF